MKVRISIALIVVMLVSSLALFGPGSASAPVSSLGGPTSAKADPLADWIIEQLILAYFGGDGGVLPGGHCYPACAE